MYEIIKNVILSKDFRLTDILGKIETIWVQGKIEDAQKDELKTLARENADMNSDVDLLKMFEDLEERVRALEEGKTPELSEYPDFKIGKVYRAGDKVTFEEKHYKCIAPVMCMLSPKAYPAYWEHIE